jgi:mono/diheme cytochrome c family protein
MKRLPVSAKGLASVFIWMLLALCAVLALAALCNSSAFALPEYSTRTGETCAVCHVNPGGGGPRTLRGLLWAAQGRPDQVPSLPTALIAPGVESGEDLYAVACAGCHGTQAEGLFAMGLAQTGIGRSSIRSYIRDGIKSIGMPAFAGQFTDAQLEALVTYVAGLADGSIAPPLHAYPLPPVLFRCGPVQVDDAAAAVCAHEAARRGGN